MCPKRVNVTNKIIIFTASFYRASTQSVGQHDTIMCPKRDNVTNKIIIFIVSFYRANTRSFRQHDTIVFMCPKRVNVTNNIIIFTVFSYRAFYRIFLQSILSYLSTKHFTVSFYRAPCSLIFSPEGNMYVLYRESMTCCLLCGTEQG